MADPKLKDTLNPWQKDVYDFHVALRLPAGCACRPKMPATERRLLRAELVREEAAELVEALESGFLVSAIDAMCDLIVVTLGTAVELNVDLSTFWREVHASNMAKKGGPIREDGKVLKPEGWKPPDLVGLMQNGRGNYVDRDGNPLGAEASE